MLDAAFVRDNLEAVKENCRNRNVKVDVAGVAAAYDRRRQLIPWHFVANQPPGNHPFGAYFTTLPRGTRNLAQKLRIPKSKTQYVETVARKLGLDAWFFAGNSAALSSQPLHGVLCGCQVQWCSRHTRNREFPGFRRARGPNFVATVSICF